MANIFQRLNFLKDFFFDPCDAPFTAYAEAFAPAALELIITWFTPSLENILFNAAKPSKALGRRRSQRKGFNLGKSGRFGKRGVLRRVINFDQDDWIGKKLQGLTGFADRTIGRAEWRLWIAYGVLERVFFWLFVADILSDFLYNWFSLVEKSEFCQAQSDAVMLRENPIGFIIGAQGWVGCYTENILKQRNIISGDSAVVIPAGQTITVTGGSTFTPLEGTQATYRTRLRTSEGKVLAEHSVDPDGSQPISTAVRARLKGPATVWFEHNCRGAVGSYTSTFSAFGRTVLD